MNKIFKTLDQQIEILKSRNLIINDEESTKDILLRENYFFINGYRHMFLDSERSRNFLEGTTFEELYATFLFDRDVRNIMFKHLLIVENNFKSIISYQLSKKYGFKEKDYLDPKNFTQDSLKSRHVHDILNKMRRQIRVNGRQHTATLHYLSNYGYIPMWILVKVLSFGIIAELYDILKYEDQMTIADLYHLDPDTLSTYLHLLANFRNLCAHEDILYDHRTQKEIPDNKYHYLLDIEMKDDHYIYGKNDLFAVVIMLKELLTEQEFNEFISELGYEIDLLDGKINVIPTNIILNCIGFPNNWRDINKV
ncbi:MAG: Abi family protein [Lactobacillales bacterium]|nr:Abi family protein [Lactobacillales bacterium]